MPIIYSAIVPHSPLLIPTIGKENTDRLKSTLSSYKQIEEDLYSLQPDTIIVISPHGPIQVDAFSIHQSPMLHGDFEEFGDFSTKIEIPGDVGLIHRIKEAVETTMPLQLITENKLDYGSTIPLFLLTKSLPKIKVVPFYYSGLDLQTHYLLGTRLQKELSINQNRIAIIASGDLSHKLEKNSPAGYSPKGKKFDQKVISLLTKNKSKDLLKIDSKTIDDVGECALRSIIIMLGMLDGVNYKPQLLSYEAPFGIGYLSMKLVIK